VLLFGYRTRAKVTELSTVLTGRAARTAPNRMNGFEPHILFYSALDSANWKFASRALEGNLPMKTTDNPPDR